MLTFHLLSAVLFLINHASGWETYRILSTKAEFESLTHKADLNVTVSKKSGLTIYLNVTEDIPQLYTAVHLAVDSNDNNDYDFDVVKRTVNCCKLFSDPSYEPVVQFLYKLFLANGNFPTECPVKKGFYYIKDMKTDPKNLPELMADRRAVLSIKHLTKDKSKMQLLTYYKVYFTVEAAHLTSTRYGTATNGPRKSKRPKH